MQEAAEYDPPSARTRACSKASIAPSLDMALYGSGGRSLRQEAFPDLATGRSHGQSLTQLRRETAGYDSSLVRCSFGNQVVDLTQLACRQPSWQEAAEYNSLSLNIRTQVWAQACSLTARPSLPDLTRTRSCGRSLMPVAAEYDSPSWNWRVKVQACSLAVKLPSPDLRALAYSLSAGPPLPDSTMVRTHRHSST